MDNSDTRTLNPRWLEWRGNLSRYLSFPASIFLLSAILLTQINNVPLQNNTKTRGPKSVQFQLIDTDGLAKRRPWLLRDAKLQK